MRSVDPKRNNAQKPQDGLSVTSHVRWVALIIAVALLIASVGLRLHPALLPKDSLLASDVLGKVGIVLLSAWLAWPTLEYLWRAPGGNALVAIAIATFGLFIYQRKTIYLMGPFLAVAVVLGLLLGWMRRLK